VAGSLHCRLTAHNWELCMTTLPLPLVLDDEPLGVILRAGRKILRPAKIWAYCWFTDEGEGGDHTHRHLPEHTD